MLSRFAVAEVIARPNTSAEANYVQLYDSTLAGVGGNASLKPYESTNIDWDYEYYFAKNSYFAVDLFYKDISNYIVNATNAEQWTGLLADRRPDRDLRDHSPVERRRRHLRGRHVLLPADLRLRLRPPGQLHASCTPRARAARCPSPRKTSSTSARSTRTSGACSA